jgi:signal transduction histidine kinase
MGVSHDVSDWVRAESEARHLHEAMRGLVAQLPDLLLVHRDGRIVFANPAAARLLAVPSAEELVDTEVGRWLPRLATGASAADGALHPDGPARLVGAQESLLLRQDGERRPGEVVTGALEWMGAPAVFVLGRDLAERRALEGQLQRSDRLAALGTLAAGMAHEINNPLTFAILQLEALDGAISSLPDEVAAPLRDRLMEIADATGRISAIVHDLRLFVRGEWRAAGAVDPLPCIERALTIAGPELRHRATIIRRLEAVRRTRGHEGRLVQVIVNLLVNAARAFPSADATAHTVEIGCHQVDGAVVIEVADNGPGIPPEIRERVFDPLFTTRPGGEGSGLGLWICHTIVAGFGGTIELQSEPGHGTRVKVRLPLAEGDQPDASVPEHAPAAPGSAAAPASGSTLPRRVMIVDDEAAIGRLMRETLSDLAMVEVFGGPAAARARLEEDDAWDLLFVDVMMPEGSGVDLLAWIRERHPALVPKTRLMTGGVMGPDLTDWLEHRRDIVLQKPFRRQQIRDLVQASAAGPEGSAGSSLPGVPPDPPTR